MDLDRHARGRGRRFRRDARGIGNTRRHQPIAGPAQSETF
jgi:hypothetical protein